MMSRAVVNRRQPSAVWGESRRSFKDEAQTGAEMNEMVWMGAVTSNQPSDRGCWDDGVTCSDIAFSIHHNEDISGLLCGSPCLAFSIWWMFILRLLYSPSESALHCSTRHAVAQENRMSLRREQLPPINSTASHARTREVVAALTSCLTIDNLAAQFRGEYEHSVAHDVPPYCGTM